MDTTELSPLWDVSKELLNASLFQIAGTPISLMTLLLFTVIVAATWGPGGW